jgi:hypothetical protein
MNLANMDRGNSYPTSNRDDLYYRSMIFLDKDSKWVISVYIYLNRYVKFFKTTSKSVKISPMPGALVIPPEGAVTGKSGSTSESDQSTSKK